MVLAVDQRLLTAADPVQERTWDDLDRVETLVVFAAVEVVGGVAVVEIERAAEGAVDQLHAAADAEKRNFMLLAELENQVFEGVALRVEFFWLMRIAAGLAMAFRLDVDTAGNDDAVAAQDVLVRALFGVQGDDVDRLSPSGNPIAVIALGDQVVAPSDAYSDHGVNPCFITVISICF